MSSKTDQLSRLYLAEHARLEQVLRRRTGCAATASDLVHDIFLRLWERAVDVTSVSPAYLGRSARNAAIDHKRSQTVRHTFAASVVPEQMHAPQATPFDIVAAQQSIDLALQALPKQTRHIFLLNRVYGRTFREIANVAGLSERVVARHIARAIAACEVASTEDGA